MKIFFLTYSIISFHIGSHSQLMRYQLPIRILCFAYFHLYRFNSFERLKNYEPAMLQKFNFPLYLAKQKINIPIHFSKYIQRIENQ